jgi:predicted Zn-ribbon and HTH transcriptional regulator
MPALTPIMTQLEYIRNKGSKCPYCHSENIQAYDLKLCDALNAEQPVQCNDCKKQWIDTFVLRGFYKTS